ncbi:MAG: hypothetical protein EOP06_04780 [Proteobacteria bacterium]|nr:MAG: hypothetical protein EOP06_04780 [Pseudomonadota bacterium]
MSVGIFVLIKEWPVLIDPEDFDRVTSRRWTVAGTKTVQVIGRTRDCGRTKRTTLERFLISPAENKYVVRRRDAAPDDFRKCSFLILSMTERQAYIGKRKQQCSSKFKGVYWSERSKAWRACIRPFGMSIALGTFDTEEDAAAAYDRAVEFHYGAGAFTNFRDRSGD